MLTIEQVARHREHLSALSVDGGPLSARSRCATTRNPEWFMQVTKEPTGARRRMHLEVLAADGERTAHVPCERRAIVLAGPPGVGKSTVLDAVLAERAGVQGDRGNWRELNSDDFKDVLLERAIADGSYERFLKPAEVRELEAQGERFYPRELAALVHEESSLLVQAATTDAIERGQNIVIDGTLSRSTKAHRLLERLAVAGYEVSIVDVEAPREVTQERVAGRWLRDYVAVENGTATGLTATLGGRWVPSSFSGGFYGAGRDDRSVSEDVAAEVAERHQVVREFDVHRVAHVDASPVHVARRGRVDDSGLLDAEAYAERSGGQPERPYAAYRAGEAPGASAAAEAAQKAAGLSFPTSARENARRGGAAPARVVDASGLAQDGDQGLER